MGIYGRPSTGTDMYASRSSIIRDAAKRVMLNAIILDRVCIPRSPSNSSTYILSSPDLDCYFVYIYSLYVIITITWSFCTKIIKVFADRN